MLRTPAIAALSAAAVLPFGCATEDTMPDQPSPFRIGGSLPAKVLNIGHRGARAFAPENTLPAIEKARALGCHMVEVDVHMSRDGELIVIHDDDLLRTTDVRTKFPDRQTWFVSDFTGTEIRTLDAGGWFAAELKKPRDKRTGFLRDLTDEEFRSHITEDDLSLYGSGEVRVPTLPEVLQMCKNYNLACNIEIKTMPRMYPGIAGEVVRLVKKFGLERQVLVSSFDHEQLVKVRELSPVIATGVLTSDRLARPGAYCKLISADAYHPGCIGESDSIGFHSVDGRLEGAAIRDALSAGRRVNVWTENDKARMRLLITAGATGVITDYPNRLRDLLAESDRR